MKTEERIRLAEEAGRLEAVGADWEAKHVAAVLGCAIKTVYDTAWMKQCSRHAAKSRRRWIPRELRAAQALESSKRDRRTFARTRRKTA